jgi:tetratricopeptide (TPR) repeat protein
LSGTRLFLLLFLLLLALPVRGGGLEGGFEQANKLYEEGKFSEAAAAYEGLIQAGHQSPTLYFNLGNAWYKAEQLGRAIAAYRRAEALEPRDPNVRFNLQFTRKKVTGSDTLPGETWRQWLETLTLNEWTGLAMGAFWATFLLLALREARPAWRKGLRLYAALAGAATLALGSCLGVTAQARGQHDSGVIVGPQAVVRYGPLEESQVYYQLRDGSEVAVLDVKKVDNQQAWAQVRDAARRIGWVRREQVIVM